MHSMIRILEVTAALDGGGVDRLLYDFCTRIMEYDNSIQFDFVITSELEGILEEPLKKMGCNIIHIHQMSGNFINYIKEVRRIIKAGNYHIVHDHMNQASMGSMVAAACSGVPVRIAHCHTFIHTEKVTRMLKRKIMSFLAKLCATDLCACSEVSAEWMWRRKDKVHIMKNAIPLSAFQFSKDKRNTFRREMLIDDKLVIGNVARFSKEKNHIFMLEMIKEIQKIEEAKLVLIGRGDLEEEIKKASQKMGIEDSVVFLGIRSDVSDLLNAMDVFILPSLYEGFPVTLVEAQANGVPIIVSDNVTKECQLSQNIIYKKLEEGAKSWAVECVRLKNKRASVLEKRIQDYDINNEAQSMCRYYHYLVEKRGKKNYE